MIWPPSRGVVRAPKTEAVESLRSWVFLRYFAVNKFKLCLTRFWIIAFFEAKNTV